MGQHPDFENSKCIGVLGRVLGVVELWFGWELCGREGDKYGRKKFQDLGFLGGR